MKKLFLLCIFLSAPLFAQTSYTAAVRKYVQRDNSYTDRPYGENDLSYGLYVDMFDGIGGWRLGASYATDLSGVGEADSVITPEITLIGAEGPWISGISLMMDYVDDGSNTEWGDLYYQFQLGLRFPIGKNLQVAASLYFPFTDLGNFGDLGFSELDYGLTVSARF